ncbi:gastrin/cholecystokinin type B receptor isoform X5 [Macaca fascicularis]|uniref:gastrin/cholecystokinin type B receptor isoform X5 n=1 Tax=Macaca fascicularis TaxID=9541 RepID=UPI003D156481
MPSYSHWQSATSCWLWLACPSPSCPISWAHSSLAQLSARRFPTSWMITTIAQNLPPAARRITTPIPIPHPPPWSSSLGLFCSSLSLPSGTPKSYSYFRSVLLLLLLFFIPGVVMAVAYGLISRELYLGLRFDGDSDSGSQSRVRSQGRLPGGAGPGAIHQNGRCRSETGAVGEDSDGCYVQLPRSRPALELSALTAPGPGSRPTQAKLLAKKRVVRMLLVIVVLFFLCWLPVYSANTWRAFDGLGAHRALSGAPISFIHLLSYASACVNPLVYCFMHRRFRQACLETCARCCPRPPRARPRPLPDEDPPTPSIASLSRLSYTTISTLGPG